MQLLSEVDSAFVLVQQERRVTAVTAQLLQRGYAWVTRAGTLIFPASSRPSLDGCRYFLTDITIQAPEVLFGAWIS